MIGAEFDLKLIAGVAALQEEAIADRDQPVLMFALEWCEFCWAVRKLFKAYNIPYRAIDLDSMAYQENDWGGRIRNARQNSPAFHDRLPGTGSAAHPG